MVTSYPGVWEAYMNGVIGNYPEWMRNEAYYGIFKAYDKAFATPLQELFPRVAAKDDKGNLLSIDDSMYVPYSADPGFMANFMDRYERVRPRAIAFGREKLWTRLVKEWGPQEDPTLFNNTLKSVFLNAKNQMITEATAKSINRRVEYELANYIFGTNYAQYSDLPTEVLGRRNIMDAGDTDMTHSGALSGCSWDSGASDPTADIIRIKLVANVMGEFQPTKGFIGPNTAAALEGNAKIISQLQYNTDVVNGLVGASIKGVTMKTVLSQWYKDKTINSSKIGYPGKGDAKVDNWDDRNKVNMMTHAVSSALFEWGLFVGDGAVGETKCSMVHNNQTDPTVPYAHAWQDAELEVISSSVSFGFGIYAADLAKYVTVKRTANKLK